MPQQRGRDFEGPDGGVEHCIATLIETCELNDVAPYAYLTDAITRIVDDHAQNRVENVLPLGRSLRSQPGSVA